MEKIELSDLPHRAYGSGETEKTQQEIEEERAKSGETRQVLTDEDIKRMEEED